MTNNRESFHFNEQFYKPRLSLFNFFLKFKDTIQTDTYIKILNCFKNNEDAIIKKKI